MTNKILEIFVKILLNQFQETYFYLTFSQTLFSIHEIFFRESLFLFKIMQFYRVNKIFIFCYYATFLCFNNYLKNLFLFFFQLLSTLYTFDDNIKSLFNCNNIEIELINRLILRKKIHADQNNLYK